MKPRRKRQLRFALCITDTDTEPDLEPRKVYQVLPDAAAARENYLRIIDETGEDYLYPANFFVLIHVPEEAQRVLLHAS